MGKWDQYERKPASEPAVAAPVASKWDQYERTGNDNAVADEPVNLNEAPVEDKGNLLRNALAGMTFNASIPAETAIRSIGAWDTYPEMYKLVQGELGKARQADPGTAMLTELGAGAVPFLIPGVGELLAPAEGPAYMLKLAQAVKAAESLPYIQRIAAMKSLIPTGAKISAIMGAKIGALQQALGGKYSIFDPTNAQGEQIPLASQLLRPVLNTVQGGTEGALFGGMTGGLIPPASQAARPVTDLIKKGGEALLKSGPVRVLSGVRKDVAEEVLPHIGAYRGPGMSAQELGNDALTALNAKSALVTQARNEARQLLTSDPALPRVNTQMIVYQGLREGGALNHDKGTIYSTLGGNSLVGEFRTLQKEINRIARSNGGVLTEQNVRELMDQVKPKTSFIPSNSSEPAKGQKVAEAWNIVYGKLNDVLREKNPDYSKAMQPIIEDVKMLEQTRKALGVRRAQTNAEGDRYEATDNTYTRMNNLRRKEVSAPVIQEFSDKFMDGRDMIGLSNRLRNENLLGMKSPGFWTIAGGTQGSKLAAAGAIRDVLGRPTWKNLALGLDQGYRGMGTNLGASLGASPTLHPKYLGIPWKGLDAEDYRAASTMNREEFDKYRAEKMARIQTDLNNFKNQGGQ